MRIAVVGGGFAGVYAMRTLQRQSRAEIVLFEPRECFVFTPLLHEVAVDVLHVPNVTYEYSEIFSRHFTHVRERVVQIRPETKEIVTASGGAHRYDYCIVAVGSDTWLPHDMDVHTLKSVEDARSLRKALKKSKSCCIVGGGPTGVELAGEIADMRTYMKKRMQVTLVHSRDRLLSGQDVRIQEEAEHVLRRKGVTIVLGTRVCDVKGNKIHLAKKMLEADTTIWTAGVRPNIIKGLAKTYIPVKNTLQSAANKHIFAAGDACIIEDTPLPDLAQVAVQQGSHAARNILRHMKGKKLKPFKYKSRGFLVSLGQKTGTGIVEGIFIRGFIAWFIWRTVYLVKFIGVRSKARLAKEYTIRLFIR